MKKRQSLYDYGECHVCGEQIEEKRIKQEFWLKNKLVLVEDVPAGVCPQCGQKVVKAEVGRWIMTLLKDTKQLRKAHTVNIPVLSFAKELP